MLCFVLFCCCVDDDPAFRLSCLSQKIMARLGQNLLVKEVMSVSSIHDHP